METLPQDSFFAILEFVGPGSYRNVAGVNRTWRSAYDRVFRDHRATHVDYFMTSVHRLSFFLEDDLNHSLQQKRRIMTTPHLTKNGRLDIMIWARARGYLRLSEVDTCTTINNGHLYMLQWCHANGVRCSLAVCYWAAMSGHVHILKWARHHGYPWDHQTCNVAAENGHLHVLQWSHEHGCAWDENTCHCAAMNGHLHVLQWARQHGCPWDTMTCWWAARNDHLAVLQWARQNGCPWNRVGVLGVLPPGSATYQWVESQPP